MKKFNFENKASPFTEIYEKPHKNILFSNTFENENKFYLVYSIKTQQLSDRHYTINVLNIFNSC